MSTDPKEQYWMQLNTIMQDKHADFEAKSTDRTVGEGRSKRTIWTVRVTAVTVYGRLAGLILNDTHFEAEATKMSTARDAASKQMVDLFRSHHVEPKVGKGKASSAQPAIPTRS